MSDADGNGGRNRLAEETSPYLLQHADNPVHWYPWGEQALAAARERDVPVLLSIGYSSCHWCHVMAHESFEDDETARLMNAEFVNVKVDREERPDLDRIYQIAHQILARQPGGWPLTVFLDPHTERPFFSGTYFPKRPRYGMPSFTELLARVKAVWQERRDELERQGEKVQEIFDSLNAQPSADAALPGTNDLKKARDELASSFDSAWGGFGGAPKFPMCSNVERLMRHWAYAGRDGERDHEALEMARTTLTRMARGGIHDHVGGGFCRYATDREWIVPHFEKMLYDNGPLLALYADALAVGADPLFETAARGIADWMLREMRGPEGAFYASLDADSEGGEGRFYLWHRDEVKRLLESEEYLVVETLFGLDKPPNFEGAWILWRRDAWHAVVERLGLERERADALLRAALAKLFDARERRERPARDEKVLTSWNALAIAGLARAAGSLGEPAYGDAAATALDFLRERLAEGGRVWATWKDGRARHPGYLDDHAYLLVAALELLELRWRDVDARFAVALADALLAHFEDAEAGGFFFTAHDHERLIHRPKPAMDESTPSGNGMAARGLSRLGHLLGRQRYIDAAERTLRWAKPTLERAPHAHACLLGAVEDLAYPPEQVIVRGPQAERWAAARGGHAPWRTVFALPEHIEPAAGADAPLLPEYLEGESADGGTRAWVCSGLSCSLPITSEAALRERLGETTVVALRRP